MTCLTARGIERYCKDDFSKTELYVGKAVQSLFYSLPALENVFLGVMRGKSVDSNYE